MPDETFGQFIKNIRERNGLTANELAKRAKIVKSYISGIERHNIIPSQKIYDRLDVVLKLGVVGKSYYKHAKDAKATKWLSSKYGLKFSRPSRTQIIHNLITDQVKGEIKEKRWHEGMSLEYLTKPKDDLAFSSELVSNFMPSEKDNKKLIREFADVIKKLRKETQDFQKRFWKTEKTMMDILNSS